jgi:hypothetical protein
MKRFLPRQVMVVATVAALSGGTAFAIQNKDTVAVPNGGMALSEFKGYEQWEVVSVSQSGPLIEVILGDPAMVAAYKTGLPAEGKQFPDGVRMVKIHWNAKKSEVDPNHALVPDTLHDVDTMMRDSKRFAATGNWGYSQFNYDAASDSFKPLGSGSACGYACHTIVKAKDYVFTEYPKR